MARIIEIDRHLTLQDYAEVAHLAHAVHELRAEAERLVPQFSGRRLWMVNSTEQGGGVAEMLPTLVGLLRDLGFSAEWAVIETEHAEFFTLTKHLHNLIHGVGEPALTRADRELYEAVSRQNADALIPSLTPDDILIVHDPQPLGTGALVEEALGLRSIWRCHIGLDRQSEQTRAAWRFLEPYAVQYDHAVFTAPEYIPSYLAGRATVINPGVDPLSHKNRGLSLHKLVGVLCDASLQVPYGPLVAPPFPEPARRLQPGGNFAPATENEDIGLLFRPIVTQISRWDRLKGWLPLMQAFVQLKRGTRDGDYTFRDSRHRRRLELARLVLAGPDPAGVHDDPEAHEVLAELTDAYRAVDPDLQPDVVLLTLPMTSRKHNALMVNALQRCSTVVAQNSLQEGFGLTAAEAMWKRVPVLGTFAVGLRQQIRDGLDGRLVRDAEDTEEIATTLLEMLGDEHALEAWGQSAEQRVHDRFLVFNQLRRWMQVLEQRTARNAVRDAPQPAPRPATDDPG